LVGEDLTPLEYVNGKKPEELIAIVIATEKTEREKLCCGKRPEETVRNEVCDLGTGPTKKVYAKERKKRKENRNMSQNNNSELIYVPAPGDEQGLRSVIQTTGMIEQSAIPLPSPNRSYIAPCATCWQEHFPAHSPINPVSSASIYPSRQSWYSVLDQLRMRMETLYFRLRNYLSQDAFPSTSNPKFAVAYRCIIRMSSNIQRELDEMDNEFEGKRETGIVLKNNAWN
jgi:hypothetical protein